MKKPAKLLLIFAGLALAALAAWYFIKKRKAATPATPSGSFSLPGSPAAPAPGPAVSPPANDPGPWPLQQGSKGKYVIALQQHLNKEHKAGLVLDGIYGPKTAAAANKYEGRESFSLPQFNAVFGK